MGTYIALVASIHMCLNGFIAHDDKCPDGQPPFEATLNVLHGEISDGCNPLNELEKECVQRWLSVIDIYRNDALLFALRPDGTTEAHEGFKVENAAIAFWASMYATAPNLFPSLTKSPK